MLSPARALVRMPDLVGMPYRKARLLAENAGLHMTEVMYAESYEAGNTVLAQAPQRGQMVYVGDRVAVAVSRDSYVRWLPAIYQRSDISGRNVVKELLWVTQHLFGSIEEQLNVGFTFYDPYETPEHFLPWLASWTAMVLEEDWPIAKKRRLIKRAVELYRIRGTLRGLKLFISLFTGHEPDVRENEWPFRGWRIGVSSAVGVDTIVLPPLNLAHTFIVEMPTAYRDLSPESVIRIHEIVRMEKPAHTQYWLRFAAESAESELREFFAIGTRSGIGIGQEILRPGLTAERVLTPAARSAESREGTGATKLPATDDFPMAGRSRRPFPTAPRADLAPVEGREVRSSEEGFGASARQMQAVTDTRSGKVVVEPPAEPAPEPMREIEGPSDTIEMVVKESAAATMISSASKRIAEELRRAKDEPKDDGPESPGTEPTRGRKKPDPKKTK